MKKTPEKSSMADQPAHQNPPDAAPRPPVGWQQTIERAASVYFDACRRLARSINHVKYRRKKR